MIVDIATRFRADVLPLRARKVRKAFVDGSASVSIAEVRSEDAPVVLRPLSWDGFRLDVRLHDGVLWNTYEASPPENPDDDNTAGIVKLLVSNFVGRSALDGQGKDAAGANRLAAGDAKVVSMQREPVASRMQDWADRNCILIDGVPHCRTGSPLISVKEIGIIFGDAIAAKVDFKECGQMPAWFAPDVDGIPFHQFLSGCRLQMPHRAQNLHHLLDIEIVRADLMDVVRSREAENTLAEEMIETLVATLRKDPRPHPALGDVNPTEKRIDIVRRAATVAFAAAAGDGASFVDAASAAASITRKLEHEQRDPGTILLQAPSDAVRTDIRMIFQGYGPNVGTRSGWNKPGRGPEFADAQAMVLEPSSLFEVATTEKNRFVTDAAGLCFVDFQRAELGLKRGSAQSWHAADLAKAAFDLVDRNDPDTGNDLDWLGASLRHQEGRRRLATDDDRRLTVQEFVFNRMALVGNRMVLRCPEPTIAVLPEIAKGKVTPWISHSISHATTPARFGELPPFMFRLDQIDEASDLAGCRGAWDDGGIRDLELAASARFSFDSALWNLRAAVKRILEDMDGRLLLLDADVAATVARLDKHVETWCTDTALVASDDAVDAFLSDAAILLVAIKDPLMEDIGADHIREIAGISLERALEDRRVADAEPDEDLGAFSM